MGTAPTTGENGRGFEVPLMFHPSHDVLDLDEAERWYERVFGCESRPLAAIQDAGGSRSGSGYPRGYSTFTPMADVLFDTIDPTRYVFDGVQRLATIERPHLRLISWYVEGIAEAYRALRRAGIRITNQVDEIAEGDDPPTVFGSDMPMLFTLAEDTGLRYAFCPVGPATARFDPRLAPDSVPPTSPHGPLGIERCSHHTILTDRPERALRMYVDALGGAVVHEGRNELLGATSTYLHIGGSTVELAVPDRGSAAHEDWAAYAPDDAYHALTWQVADLAQAERHLEAEGVKIRSRSATTIVTDPGTSLGIPWGFTTTAVPGDPRPGGDK